MKIDAREVVDARTAAVRFLEAEDMDEELLAEAMQLLNTESDLQTPHLAKRAAWHTRQIAQHHRDWADYYEKLLIQYPSPNAGEVLRWKRREAQDYFDLADAWERHAKDLQAHSRRQKFYVVPAAAPIPKHIPTTEIRSAPGQLRLPGID